MLFEGVVFFVPAKDNMQRYRLTGRDVCPYHKFSTPSGIFCEGFFDNTSLGITFGDRGEKKEYQHRYCCKDWEKCLMAMCITQLVSKHMIFQ